MSKDKDVDFEKCVYLAVELINKKVKKIRMSVYPYDNVETFTDFILNSVEDNSSLQLSFPIKRICGVTSEMRKKGISDMWKPFSYNFQYVEKTFDDFMNFYKSNKYSPESLEKAVYDYTKSINSFNPEISFEELLRNAAKNNTRKIRRLPFIK